MNLAQTFLVLVIRAYQWGISPVVSALGRPLGLGCRFTPSCSAYALEAVQKRGAWRGTALAAVRLCRCHPWGGCGHDPVPDAETKVSRMNAKSEAEAGPSAPIQQALLCPKARQNS